MAIAFDLIPSAEAHRARSTHSGLPRCDGLRACSLALISAQCLRTTRASEFVDLGIVVRAGFALTGFLLASFLLRGRSGAGATIPSGGPASRVGTILGALPNTYLFGVVAAILYLPRIFAVQSVPLPDPAELPAWVIRGVQSSLEDFLRPSVEGGTLMAWPLLLLLAPTRLLGFGFLAMLGSGLMVEFAGLVRGELAPASIFVAPSPLDLLAAGALVAAICQGFGRSGDVRLARWALLMGLALAAGSIGYQPGDALGRWGSWDRLSAPTGFGALNFLLKVMATTLVGSLAWRDVGR